MKIVALNGSHRGRRGFTQSLLGEMKAGAEEGGAAFEIIVLAEKNIIRCSGCDACHAVKGRLRCVHQAQDDVGAIFAAMRAADIIVFATPVYIFAMSSLLKSLLDRINSTGDTKDARISRKGLIFHHIDAALCSKPFVLLASCGNIEAETPKNVVDYFKTYSRFMDAPMLSSLVRTGSHLLEKTGETPLPAKAGVMTAFHEAGKALAATGKVPARLKRRAERNVVPMPAPIRILICLKPLRARLFEEARKTGALRLN
jgi:multimeric flavodoxin WrbA